MQITVDIPDELAQRLDPLKDELPQILMLGLREVEANPASGFSGLTQILEFMASLPSPQEILALQFSEPLQTEIDRLVEKKNAEGLNPTEQYLWQQYKFVEHLVSIAKTRALLKLKENAVLDEETVSDRIESKLSDRSSILLNQAPRKTSTGASILAALQSINAWQGDDFEECLPKFPPQQ